MKKVIKTGLLFLLTLSGCSNNLNADNFEIQGNIINKEYLVNYFANYDLIMKEDYVQNNQWYDFSINNYSRVEKTNYVYIAQTSISGSFYDSRFDFEDKIEYYEETITNTTNIYELESTHIEEKTINKVTVVEGIKYMECKSNSTSTQNFSNAVIEEYKRSSSSLKKELSNFSSGDYSINIFKGFLTSNNDKFTLYSINNGLAYKYDNLSEAFGSKKSEYVITSVETFNDSYETKEFKYHSNIIDTYEDGIKIETKISSHIKAKSNGFINKPFNDVKYI